MEAFRRTFIRLTFMFSLYPKELNNSWMAAELSHLLSADQMKDKLYNIL